MSSGHEQVDGGLVGVGLILGAGAEPVSRQQREIEGSLTWKTCAGSIDVTNKRLPACLPACLMHHHHPRQEPMVVVTGHHHQWSHPSIHP